MTTNGQDATRERLNDTQGGQRTMSGDGLMSSVSSQTAIPAGRSSAHPSLEMADKERAARSSSESGHEEPEDPTGGLLREELEKAGNRSTSCTIILVATCTVGMILNTASSSVGAITLPSIGRDFNAGEDKLQWVVSAFSLSSGCLFIFFGRLADLYGRKMVFLFGSLWLGVFSLGCGFANDIITLNVLRGVQGIGAAAVIPASLGILAHAFPPSRTRSIAFASFSTGAPVGGAIGLQIGGILTQWAPATWRASFYLLAGLGVPVLAAGWIYIDNDEPSTEKDKRVDWIGAALVTSALVLITFVLGEGEVAPKRWKTPYIIALLVVGVVLLVIFIIWEGFLERNQSNKFCPPLMKLSLWTRARGMFAATQSIAFLEWSSFMSWQFWVQLYYQDYEGLDPVQTSIRFLPMFIVGVLCNFFVAAVVARVPYVILVGFGTLLTGIAGLLFALMDKGASYWAFGLPANIVCVFGADFVFPCGTIFVAKVCKPHEQSLAAGLFQTLTQLGTALGLAATTIVHNSVLRRKQDQPDVDAEFEAYRATHWLVFAFGAFGALVAFLLLRGVGPVGNRSSIKSITGKDHTEDA